MIAWSCALLIHYLAFPWVRVAVTAACVLAALLALFLFVLCVLAGIAALRRKQQARYPINLTSECNLPVTFQLNVELNGLQKTVKTLWSRDGKRITPKIIKHTSYVETDLPAQAAPTAKATSKRPPKKKAPSKEQQALQEGEKKVSTLANLVASIAGGLAAILPGKLKTPFRAINAGIREQQKTVSQTKADVEHLKSTTRTLGSNVERLGSETGVNGANGGHPSQPAEKKGRLLVVTKTEVTETHSFAPGETSQYELVLRPYHLFQPIAGKFCITSQPVETKEYPLYGSLPPQTLVGDLNIQALPGLYLAFFILYCAVCLAIHTGWCMILIRWLLQLR